MKLNSKKPYLTFVGAAMALGLLLAPMHASAQDQLPDLEGTTYGLMLEDLDTQLQRLQQASAEEYGSVLHQTAVVMANQNQTMIRMIDALHDKVNGLIAEDQDTIQAGEDKFEHIGIQYRGMARP